MRDLRRTTKPERRQAKREWLQWRRLARDLDRAGAATITSPEPGASLAEFCRWKRAELPRIAVRFALTIHNPTE